MVDGSLVLMGGQSDVSLSLYPETLGTDGISSGYIQCCCCYCFDYVTLYTNLFQAAPQPAEQAQQILCKHCNHNLGLYEEASHGWRIWKWSVSVSTGSSTNLQHADFTPQKWISARLLYLVENSGVRKFHIRPISSATPATNADPPCPVPSLLVWVFTPDLMYSSSVPSPGRQDPTRSIKIFYKKQTWQPLQPGEPESASVDDVEFPAQLFEELECRLNESQQMLPPTARSFQGWNVGLLERFDVSLQSSMHHSQ